MKIERELYVLRRILVCKAKTGPVEVYSKEFTEKGWRSFSELADRG